MNPKELYEKQYGEKKLRSNSSFLFLRRIFKKFDLHRESLALSMLKDSRGKFLDIGCGSGSLVFKARKEFNEVYGIDISSSRIKEAKEKVKEGLKNVYFDTGNLDQKLNFSDKAFDVVTCLAVLEHVFDPYFAIN